MRDYDLSVRGIGYELKEFEGFILEDSSGFLFKVLSKK